MCLPFVELDASSHNTDNDVACSCLKAHLLAGLQKKFSEQRRAERISRKGWPFQHAYLSTGKTAPAKAVQPCATSEQAPVEISRLGSAVLWDITRPLQKMLPSSRREMWSRCKCCPPCPFCHHYSHTLFCHWTWQRSSLAQL